MKVVVSYKTLLQAAFYMGSKGVYPLRGDAIQMLLVGPSIAIEGHHLKISHSGNTCSCDLNIFLM